MSDGNRSDIKLLVIVLIVAGLAVAAAVVYLVPAAEPLVAQLQTGMGLKTAALWGFGATVGLFVLLALVAGDGLLGEIQFMLGSFFGFFFILTLLIAWVF